MMGPAKSGPQQGSSDQCISPSSQGSLPLIATLLHYGAINFVTGFKKVVIIRQGHKAVVKHNQLDVKGVPWQTKAGGGG